jgi:predicted DNA-binding transcriptional regulator YafY
MTNKDTILRILKSGRNMTVAQLAGLCNATPKSVYNRIAELRAEGFAIYRNETKTGKQAYRLGTPSREMVRTAFLAGGSHIFQ